MGILALSDFVSEITLLVGARTDLTPQRIILALNHAQAKLAKETDWRELQQYSSLSTNYTGIPVADKFLPYPPLWKTVHSIVLQNGTESRKLKNMPWRKFDRLYPSPETVAAYIPLVYADWNQQLIFMPAPNSVYPLQCRVTMYPAAFTAASPMTTQSQFQGKDEILSMLAAAYLWRGFGRYDKAQEYESSAEALVMQAIKANQDMPDLDTSGGTGTGVTGAYWANPWIMSSP